MDATGLRYLPWYPIAGGSGEGEPPPPPPPSDPPTPGETDGQRDERKFSKAELATAVQDALRRERDKTAADQKKLADDAEAKRLTDQQEFKALADKHEARVKELEPQAQQAERYEAALKKHLDAARKDLPGHITELLDQLDVAAQLEWISAHQAELAKPANGTTGVPATPRAAGAPSREEAINEKVDTLRRTGAYGRF